MDIFKAVQERRSCRKYLEKPVEFEKVTLMLEAGTHAPSAGNIQPWKYILVNDKGSISKVASHCFQQYWIESAPLIIAVCSCCEKMGMHYGERGMRLYSIQSVAAAIENMLLTATGLGLTTCWVGAFEDEKIKTLLKVPANVNVHALITVGYPDEKPKEKNFVPLSSCVFFNTYGMKIKHLNRVLNDYSVVVDKYIEQAQPVLDKLLNKLKNLGKKK